MTELAAPPEVAGEAAHPAAPRALEFKIVPRVGLALGAIVMALLIAGIAANSLWPLELLHVAGGAGWTIVDLFLGLVLGPIIGSLAPPARVEMTIKLLPKIVVLMPFGHDDAGVGLAAVGPPRHQHQSLPAHGWVVASFIVVGVMSVIALGLLEPANIAVLFDSSSPDHARR